MKKSTTMAHCAVFSSQRPVQPATKDRKASFDASQLDRLKEIAATDPDRIRRALEAVWLADPDLQREVSIESTPQALFDEALQCARLPGTLITVWEIVRAHRKGASEADLTTAFPTLSSAEIALALAYGDEHPAEIDAKIEDFERVLLRRRTEYPFSR